MSDISKKPTWAGLWLSGIVLPLMVGIFAASATVWVSTYFRSTRQLEIQQLKIALGILRQESKNHELKSIRRWAVDVIDQHLDTELPQDARTALVEQGKTLKISPFLLERLTEWWSAGDWWTSRLDRQQAAASPDLVFYKGQLCPVDPETLKLACPDEEVNSQKGSSDSN
ncbi:MAG: hypothetical protein ACR2PG_07465 [Hyphomicrobiaceae bacterium]